MLAKIFQYSSLGNVISKSSFSISFMTQLLNSFRYSSRPVLRSSIRAFLIVDSKILYSDGMVFSVVECEKWAKKSPHGAGCGVDGVKFTYLAS